MTTYTTHTLTDLEEACGVTLKDVARELPRVYMPDSATAVLPAGLAPALAGSVARCAIGDCVYAGLNGFDMPIYRARHEGVTR